MIWLSCESDNMGLFDNFMRKDKNTATKKNDIYTENE